MSRTILIAALAMIAVVFGTGPAAAHEGGAEEAAFRVSVVHAVPGLGVDVTVGEGSRFKGVDLGEMIYLGSETDEDLQLVFKRTGTNEVVFETVVDLSTDERISMIFASNPDGGYQLDRIVHAPPPIAAGAGRLLVRNLDAQPIDVTLTTNGAVVFDGILGGDEQRIDLPPGPLDLTFMQSDIQSDSGADGQFVETQVDVSDGDETVVYLVGSFESGTATTADEVVHDLDIDPSASAPVDLESVLKSRNSQRGWVGYVGAAVAAALLLGPALVYAKRRAAPATARKSG